MLTVKEMAAKMNLTTSRVLQLLWAGRFPGARKNGRAWLIPEPKPAKSSLVVKAPVAPAVKALGLNPRQRAELSVRTKAGLAAARAKGRVLGRPKKMALKKKEAARKLLDGGRVTTRRH